MRLITLDEIKSYPIKDLVEDLRNREFSLLWSLGFKKLRAEMLVTGWVCELLMVFTGLRSYIKREGPDGASKDREARQRITHLLQRVTPATTKTAFPHYDCGMVVGFNHPSLGELLRFICICSSDYGDQRNLFPVNLPWYEALMPIARELEVMGVYMTPIITPSTRNKMAKLVSDEAILDEIDVLSRRFNNLYLEKCREFAKTNDNIWVAPSATRQATLFKTKAAYMDEEPVEPQTMSLLALTLMRAKVQECVFLGIGVIPPKYYSRGLNLFRKYTLIICKPFEMAQIRDKIHQVCECGHGKLFELEFLDSIARGLMMNDGYKFVYPRNS